MLSGPSGATRCSRLCAGPRGAMTSGASASTCRRGASDTQGQFFQFLAAYDADYVTRDGRLVIDDPEVRRRLIEAIDSLHRRLPQGLHPARFDRPGRTPTTTRQFLAQAVVMTPELHALDPQRAEARASGGLLREQLPRSNGRSARTARLSRSRVSSVAAVVFKDGRNVERRQGVRALPRGRGLARALSRLRGRAHAAADAEAARGAVLARPERPAPHGRGDADRIAAHGLRLHVAHGRLAPRAGLAGVDVWAKAIHRVAAEGISPEQAVDEAIARIKQILAE